MLNRSPLAPFAIAIFPILAMLANNAKEVSLNVALRPLAVSLILALLLLILFRLLLRRWDKAALVTAFLLVIFFSYGHIYSLLEQHPIAGFSLGRHRYLLLLYALVHHGWIVGDHLQAEELFPGLVCDQCGQPGIVAYAFISIIRLHPAVLPAAAPGCRGC